MHRAGRRSVGAPLAALTTPNIGGSIMAGIRLCAIDGCGKRSQTRGWCDAHYRRWLHHGDPVAGRANDGDLARFLHDVVMPYTGDECLYWPYSANRGYGVIFVNGVSRYVHRLVCEDEHGTPPTTDHEAAHSCGKGHLGCCARRHLSWKTRAENVADMHIHGTVLRGEAHPSSKLTDEQVQRIVGLRGKMSQSEIAKLFNICRSNVGRVQNVHGRPK